MAEYDPGQSFLDQAAAAALAPVDSREAFEALSKRIELAAETDVDALQRAIASAQMSRSSEELLLKRMAKRFGLALRALRADLAAEKGDGSTGDGKDHLAWAREVITRLGDGDTIYTQSTFWRWDASGVWRAADDREVKQAAHAAIAEGGSVTRAIVDGVTDVVKTELFAADTPFDREDWRRVNVLNGTLRLDADGWRLEDHARDDYLTTQLPVAYDPAAKCPRFAQFLREVFDGDPDAREKARCVVEAIGYTALTTCRFEDRKSVV